MAAAIFNTGGNAAGMLGPALMPYLADRFSWKGGMAFSCAYLLLGAAAWFGVNLPASHTATEDTVDLGSID